MRLRFLVHVNEHQCKQEKNHNGTSVYNDVDGKKKLRIQQQIMPTNSKETEDQIQHAMHRLARQNHHQCAEDAEGGEYQEG